MPHAWAAGWLAAGLVLVAAAAALAAVRSDATAWRGRGLLTFTALFVAVAGAVTLAVTDAPPLALLAAAGALLLIAWATRRRWLVLGAGPASVGTTLEGCTRRLCATCEREPAGYRVPLSGGDVRVRLRGLGTRATLLTFDAPRRHRKAELLQELLAKQYHGALPTIRLPMR